MAKSVNKVFLLGNIGRTPDYKYTPSGTAVATFGLAINERVKVGERWEDSTQWHDCTVFGKLADVVREHVAKGARIHVEGRLRNETWADRDTGKQRTRTRIIVSDLTLVGARREPGEDSDESAPAPAVDASQEITDDDIPF